MKTKKNVEVLLENGIHFNTISKMTPNEVKLLAEKFFKSRPMGDIGQAKKDSLKSMRAFIKTYLGRENTDNLSYKEALEIMKMVARHAKSPNSNRITNLGADVYNIANHLNDYDDEIKGETSEEAQITKKIVNQALINSTGEVATTGPATITKTGTQTTVTSPVGSLGILTPFCTSVGSNVVIDWITFCVVASLVSPFISSS